MTVTKTLRRYWGIIQNGDIKFQGTHSECWNWLIKNYGDQALKTLVENGFSLSRIN